MQRHGGHRLRFVRIAVNEPVRRFVEVEIRKREQDCSALGMRAPYARKERRQKELLPRRVQCRSRNRERSFDIDGAEEAFFETRPETIEKSAVDGVDRNDANAGFHLGRNASTRRAGKLLERCEGRRMMVGIGIDLAEVERYRFDERQLAWFARKIYTEEEMTYAMRKRHWPERLAGFFAAKEATRKAFGHAIPWRLVGVSHERSGKPIIRLYGEAERLIPARSVRAIHLTITHSATTAAAVVVLES